MPHATHYLALGFGIWNLEFEISHLGKTHLVPCRRRVGSRDIHIHSISTGIFGDIHRIVSGFDKPLQTEAFLELH